MMGRREGRRGRRLGRGWVGRALEVEDDGVGCVGAAVLEGDHRVGVGGGDPEGAEGGGLWGRGGGGGELPGSVGSLPEVGGRVGWEEKVGRGGVIAEGAAGDGTAGVEAEVEADAGLGLVAV